MRYSLPFPSRLTPALGLVILALTTPSLLPAASPGTDSADDVAYQKEPAWSGGDNGGRGFLGWNLVGSGNSAAHGFFIGDSSVIGHAINKRNGRAFAMFGKGPGNRAEAYRTFDAPLEPGQSFSVDIAVNFRSGHKGIDLRGPKEDGERVLLNFNIGADDYVVHKAATGNGSISDTYHAETAFRIEFTQTSPTGGTWSITRTGGEKGRVIGTYEGVAGGVKFYVGETDDGSENDLWINNLTISAATKP